MWWKINQKGFDKANNQIWYCKHYHRHYVFKRKDIHDRLWIYRYIDFLLGNKKIKDFNVSKLTFYQKISKFRNTNIFLPGDSQQYDQIFVDALWLWYIFWCIIFIYFLRLYSKIKPFKMSLQEYLTNYRKTILYENNKVFQ